MAFNKKIIFPERPGRVPPRRPRASTTSPSAQPRPHCPSRRQPSRPVHRPRSTGPSPGPGPNPSRRQPRPGHAISSHSCHSGISRPSRSSRASPASLPRRHKTDSSHSRPVRTGSYGVDVPAMQPERHGWDIHAVSAVAATRAFWRRAGITSHGSMPGAQRHQVQGSRSTSRRPNDRADGPNEPAEPAQPAGRPSSRRAAPNGRSPSASKRTRRHGRGATQITTSRRDEMTFWSILVTKRLASRDHRHSRFAKPPAGFLAEVLRA